MIAELDRTTTPPTATEPAVPTESRWDRIAAPVMFGVAFFDLLVMAGLVHRAMQSEATLLEIQVMEWAIGVLWPLFVVDAAIAFVRRSPEVSRGKALARVLLVLVLPPFRIAWVHPVTNRIWLPRYGWRPPGRPLLKLLDKVFGGPMLVFALLIVPVLLLESFQSEKMKSLAWFALALHIGTALIWVAFATEFVVKVSASPSTLQYLKERWLDLAIVALPTLEYFLTHWVDAAPLARLLRLSRAVGPQQINELGRAYRLRGLMMKGWHAVMIFEVVTRLTGNSPEKRLRKVEGQIADLEEQLAELRATEETLKKQIAESTTTVIVELAPVEPPPGPR